MVEETQEVQGEKEREEGRGGAQRVATRDQPDGVDGMRTTPSP